MPRRPREVRPWLSLAGASTAPVVLAAAGFYLAFTLAGLALHGWDPLWFLWLGERFADLDPGGRTGYDGQFSYYIARDWLGAIPHLDNPPYRLQRMLHPLLGRALSWGQAPAIPWALLLVNLAALAMATQVLARWLASRQVSPWYALAYSASAGQFLAYSRALNEPLAFALAACGLVAWLRKDYLLAAVLLAVAALGKETVLFLVLGLALAVLMQRRYLPGLAVLAASALPFLAWQGWLFGLLGALPLAAGAPLELVPLGGILPYLNLEQGRLSAFVLVALPAAVAAGVSLAWLAANRVSPLAWLLLVQGLFVLALPFPVYDHVMAAGRNASGLVLVSVLAIPRLPLWARLVTSVFWAGPSLPWLVVFLRWAPWLSPA